jgi:hypothetical protein
MLERRRGSPSTSPGMKDEERRGGGSTFHLVSNDDRTRQWHKLSLQALHGSDLFRIFGEIHGMNSRE